MVKVLAGQIPAQHQAQADRQALARADPDDARAAVAVGLQEVGGLGAEQRDIRLAGRRNGLGEAGLHVPQAGLRHLGIAGELVDEAAQHHRIGIGDRVLDGRVVRRPQLRP